eukprot:2025976-Amphidinium_carterae.1
MSTTRTHNMVREVIRVQDPLGVPAGDATWASQDVVDDLTQRVRKLEACARAGIGTQQEAVEDVTLRVRVLEENSRRWAEQEAEAILARLAQVEDSKAKCTPRRLKNVKVQFEGYPTLNHHLDFKGQLSRRFESGSKVLPHAHSCSCRF